MNAHQTIGIVTTTAKAPAGAPPNRLAIRIAGKKLAKHSFVPNETSTSCIAAASAITSNADKNADGDQGLTLRMYSALLRVNSSRKMQPRKREPIARKTQLKARPPAVCH